MQGFIARSIPLMLRRLVTMAPALIVLAIGLDPTRSLVISQVVLSFGIPFALVPLVLLTRRARRHGRAGEPPDHDGRGRGRRGDDHRAEHVPAVPDVHLGRKQKQRREPDRLWSRAARRDLFQAIVDSLPDDWTDLELDLRIFDEARYIDASLALVTCNAQPYSRAEWHWRLLVAHRFGHAASAPTVHGTLKLLDDAGIEGELAVREVRQGRVEVVQMWGRPESVRQEFRRQRAQ